ncbi:insulinase family protein [Cryomorpha ignava]|uniref:Insulinase family protein n=1 Tax=Cryomorpha ignava TaxID=101383 RepID=A0A7K3WMT8_9FLAO|nr:pitrilysin family protein [Cryomorpha ignava]NEN22804.1 insulinase family protein [Cryomorpha ignava]
MEFLQHTLSNGIRLVLKPTSNSQTAHFGLTVNAGSRDELDNEQGLAHFIEHCLFKGTKRRKAFHILNRMDSVGAELNAYTTKEETVIYASFLKTHFERAVEAIADIALNSIFPEKEIAKEKDVILDEILSYQDSPSELIFDDFEELVFKNHPIGRNILGTEESVKALSKENILDFLSRRYKTSEMVLSAVGNIDFKKFIRLAEKYFGEIPESSAALPRKPVTEIQTERKLVEMDTFQAHLIMGGEAYANDHKMRTATVLMNNYLGGPAMNSRLNMNIRERHGIAYNIESGYQPYTDSGIFSIYLGTDKKLIEKSEKLVLKELKNLRNTALTSTALHRTKLQFKGQFALAQEGGVNMMLALGKSIISRDEVISTVDLMQKLDAVSTKDILEVANEILDSEKMSVLIYG